MHSTTTASMQAHHGKLHYWRKGMLKLIWSFLHTICKGLNYWENLVWSDETQIELLATIPHAMFAGEMALHMTLKIPYQEWCFRGGSIMVWGCFSSHGTGRINIIKGKMNGGMHWEFLRLICCHPPGWWRWDFGGPSTRTTIQNTLQRRVWIGSRRRK